MDTQGNERIVDLTHTLSADIPSFGGDCCFTLNNLTDYKDCAPPNLFRVQKLEAKSGAGTHIDAPAHCIPGAKTIDALDPKDLITDCVVISLGGEVGADENYIVMPEVVDSFEKEYGTISPNTFVIFHTGWERYWGVRDRYRNDLKFPSIHPDTAKLLLERNIAGIGTDTLSADAGGKDFPVHRIILVY